MHNSYQQGPDTMLLQHRDPDYPLRVREYLRVGARESPYLANNLRSSYWGDADVSYSLSCAIPSFYHTTNEFGDRTTQIGYGFSPQVAVRERRRYSAIVKEIQVRIGFSFYEIFFPERNHTVILPLLHESFLFLFEDETAFQLSHKMINEYTLYPLTWKKERLSLTVGVEHPWREIE